jgi:hypothetical protein
MRPERLGNNWFSGGFRISREGEPDCRSQAALAL